MTSVTFTFIVAVVSLLGRTFGHYCKTFVDSTASVNSVPFFVVVVVELMRKYYIYVLIQYKEN